ncbi:MAG: carbon-nitrogen hydrolase [Methanotrichaceae archaeon]|nr:carbon-nitrogen hydrolase [Methanotrichaceae archaeon]
MEHGKVKVGLIQTSVTEDRTLNIKKTVEKAREAIFLGAKIICLQELYRTQYFPQWLDRDVSDLAETIPGESTEVFSALAREHQVVIIVPIFEKDQSLCYNSIAVIDADGKILCKYRKVHLPQDPLFYEKSYFQAGHEFHICKTRYARVAVLICYDQWFPEAARIVTLQGADIIFYPTAIGWIKDAEPEEGDWLEAWQTIQRGHAIANGVHVVAVNRVGIEDDLIFWGSSFICDPFGRIIAKASDKKEEVIVAELDLSRNDLVREGWGFLKNRRPDIYEFLLNPRCV